MNVEQAVKKTNKLEMAGYAILDEIGEAYEPQKLMFGKFCVDAIYADLRIVVQFDGDYWHGHPINFPTPDARQARRMNIDRSQDAYFTKAGYTVLRLWESDIKKNRTGAVDSVRDTIHAATLPMAA
uniref:DUF559 domain-containing protein n=1 Tax=Rhizobium leguminosarum TaxID=384 RepID=A0A179BVJ2_RHILE|nr:hypothetical protein A4U53_18045 [Rhizobium leguminosarum]